MEFCEAKGFSRAPNKTCPSVHILHVCAHHVKKLYMVIVSPAVCPLALLCTLTEAH